MPSPLFPRRLLCAGLGCASIVAAGASAAPARAAVPAVDGSQDGPVGGALLGGRGVAVQLAPGMIAPPAVQAASWVLADLDTGEVLAAKDAHGKFAPASTLKMLTAVTFIPRLDPNARVLVPYAAGAVDGTKVGVVPGMRYPVHELMTAMLIQSANDAATTVAMAEQSLGRGVALMNQEAARLRAYDTHARTPSGLDAKGQLSSAYDLALIGRAGLQLPTFREYVATRRSSISAPHHKRYEIYTHNHLLLNYKGAFGIKNGYTVAAKASFVGAAERNNHRLIVAMMRGTPLLWKEGARLLDWGFRYDGAVTPVGQLVDPLPLPGSGAGAQSPAPSAVRTSALGQRAKTSGLDLPVAPLIAAGVVVTLFVFLRMRSRRRRGYRLRSRRKLSLPPI